MTRLIRRSALIIGLLVVAAHASAQVVLLSQTRSISGSGGWDLGEVIPDSTLAPDFGLFEEVIEEDSSNGWFWAEDPYWYYSATQESEIQTGHFSVHGQTTAMSFEGGWGWAPYFEGSTHSDFEVVFEVSVPTPFSLIGSLVGAVGSFASFQLDWHGSPYLFFSPGGNEEMAVSENGVLEPGVYTLRVNASTSVAGSATLGSSSFDLDFFLETPVAVDEMAWGQVKALYR